MTSGSQPFRPGSGDPPPGASATPAASANAGTPLYDELVAALITPAGTDVAPDASPPLEQVSHTGEGAAILKLFGRLKDIEDWQGGDAVQELRGWFVATGHGVVDIWDLDASAALRRLCTGIGEPITEEQWRRAVPDVPYRRPC